MASQQQMRGSMMADEQSASRMMDPAYQAQAPQATAGMGDGWKTQDVTIKQADNGGFIVRCSHSKEAAPSRNGPSPGNDYKSEELAFGTLQEVIGYVTQAFGGQQAPADNEAAETSEPANASELMA